MSESLVQDLRAQLAAGNVVLIVGAGVSRAASAGADVALWTGLLADGVQRCSSLRLVAPELARAWLAQIQFAAGAEDLIMVAERLTTTLGGRTGGEYARWLAETVGTLPIHDTGLLEAVCALGAPIITTNYDDLLERAMHLPYVAWQEPRKLGEWLREKRQAIVHIHGHWDKPESVVLGVRSYEDILGQKPAQSALAALVATRTLVFVGVRVDGGLADPNFGRLRQWIAEVHSQSTHRHYVLVKDDEVDQARALLPLAERILPLSYGARYEDLPGFLRTLVPPPLSPSGEVGQASQDDGRSRAPHNDVATPPAKTTGRRAPLSWNVISGMS